MPSPVDEGNSLAQVESRLLSSSHTFDLDERRVRSLVTQPTLVAKEDTLGVQSVMCAGGKQLAYYSRISLATMWADYSFDIGIILAGFNLLLRLCCPLQPKQSSHKSHTTARI